MKTAAMRSHVANKLAIGWLAEQIAQRLRLKKSTLRVSHEAIYQYIYSDWKEGIGYLTRRHPKRYPKQAYRKRRHHPPIINRVSILERPAKINERREGGHWESDTVECNQSCVSINVLYERVTRVVHLTRLPRKTAVNNEQAIIGRLEGLPKKARRSITYDNGPENYCHNTVNAQLGTRSYFCQPYHSWEKGGVENSNGLLRRFVPKKTNLAEISEEKLKEIESRLNNRPRKCLGFKTPREVFVKRYGANPP